MKLKYYLRGIGIGMLVTTIILMIAFSMHKEQLPTDDEIRERAAQLGMVMPEDLPVSDKLSDTQPSAQTDDEQEAAEIAQNDGSEPLETDEKNDADASDKKTKDDKSDAGASKEDKAEEKTKQEEVIEQVEITIVGGEYSDAVCKKLKKAGIIKDADDFNKYLSEGGYDNLIQPGNYVIPMGADYDEIVKLITEKKR